MANIPLQTLTFSDLIDNVYTVPQVDDTLTQTGYAADAKVTGDEITALKADLSDKDALTVGTAKQLVGDKFTEDEVPYLYRQSGGELTVGNREYLDAIVGGTVVWNQLYENKQFGTSTESGITYTKTSDYVWTLNGTASATNTKSILANSAMAQNHIYYVGNFNSFEDTLEFLFNGWKKSESIVKKTDTQNLQLRHSANAVFDNAEVKLMLIDLTAMFGTEIADHIYALEQANAGDGVAFFKKLFPNDYYAYNAGELISVSGVSAHETVGFNQWDEEWESGFIDETGINKDNNYYFRSKNYIPVIPNATYFYKCPIGYSDYARFRYYDANKQFVSQIGTSVYVNRTFTIPAGVHYMRFTTGEKVGIGVTYNHDICINLSDPVRNGTYEPYTKHSYSLDSTLTLRGVPKLVDGKVQYDGDRYLPDGTVQRRYGVVDLGTLNWEYNSTYDAYCSATLPIKANTAMICAKYPYVGSFANLTDKSVANIFNTRVAVRDSAYVDAATFKAAMSGVMLVYELATPTTETAEPYRSDQLLDAGGTEEFISTGIVPVGHETRYAEDLVKKLESLPWDMSMIAPIETGTTASQAYAVGKYFILNDQFCKAKTAIASGATFTLNTNYEITTVADELYTALH